ncbi:MAG: heme lyase CcmF/NrfE family subunit, partial [Proteobacteria bacterium]|nr:heme lyase CcmF/NrfE family subunit [Pseudomonadota bacterium]
LCIAAVQTVMPLVGAHRREASWMAVAGPAAIGQFVFLALSFGALTYSFVVSDFSVITVAANSHTAKPMLYKISGVWGNHEGSMLMWVLILALYGGAVALFGNNLPPTLKARVLGIQALIGVAFMLFIVLTSNPFERLVQVPLDGRGLNPLLQDPGLAFHPPLLYLGYVGFSMTFSFAVAALIEGRIDPSWARWVRPWTLVAWGFLTGGIALGSWWAYYELGWGGWWFWDPVENASFMPWLAGTALLHSAIVAEKRDALKSWTIFLAIIAFALSLLGTFIVRSGILTSVHSFAADPSRGVFILALLVLTVGGAFTLFAWRGPSMRSTGTFQPLSREGGLVINNFLLTTATASVLLGTLYPLFIDALGIGKISVGAPFFEAVFIPMMVPLIAVMGIGPFLNWKRSDLLTASAYLKSALLISIAAIALTWFLIDRSSLLAAFGVGLSAWLLAATFLELSKRILLFRAPLPEVWRRLMHQPRASWGMTLAHAGLAIAVAGMTASSAWKTEKIQVMQTGDTVQVGGYDYKFLGAKEEPGPNYTSTRGTFEVTRNGKHVVTMDPEKRVYQVSKQTTTEAAIYSTFFGDLYAVVGDPDPSGGFVARLYFNPLVPWMWAGTLIMVFGAGISLSDRRHRVGAPSRTKTSASSSGLAPAE